MRKSVLVPIVMIISLVICACGNIDQETSIAISEETNVQNTENATATATNEVDNAISEIESIGDVEVDKNLFDVTLTIPKDFVGDITQEELDKATQEKGYKSATLNDDGSVTYVMTKEQHKELLSAISISIDQGLADMISSEEYPEITDISANEDYTSFTVTTNNTELSLAESFSVITFYMYGGSYAVFSGKEVDNIHIEFVNANTGETINTADSKDLGQ